MSPSIFETNPSYLESGSPSNAFFYKGGGMGFPLNLSNITMVGVYFVFFPPRNYSLFMTKSIYKDFVMYLIGPLEEGKWPRGL